MGTTLTAVYVGEQEVAIAHVGDSRAYCLRDGELLRLTDDHSLVDELVRQGRLTPEEAVEHPQRSVITRALGPEVEVEVDTRSFRAAPATSICCAATGSRRWSDEAQLAAVLLAHPRLSDAGEALIAAANEAGGRDNITVVLLRLEEVHAGRSRTRHGAGANERTRRSRGTGSQAAHATMTGTRRRADHPRRGGARATPRPRHAPAERPSGEARRVRAAACSLRRAGALVAWWSCSACSVRPSTSPRSRSTSSARTAAASSRCSRGVPYRLPGNLNLYSSDFVSGVSASTLLPERRRALLDHSLRSEGDAAALIRSLELGQLE